MRKEKEFPFEKARRISSKEVESARKAIEANTGEERAKRGRPKKAATEKHRAVSIRLHPKVLVWAKKEAKKRGIGYQTVINEVLLRQVA